MNLSLDTVPFIDLKENGNSVLQYYVMVDSAFSYIWKFFFY